MEQIILIRSDDISNRDNTESTSSSYTAALADPIHSVNENIPLQVGLKSFNFINTFYNVLSTFEIPCKIRYVQDSTYSTNTAWPDDFNLLLSEGYYNIDQLATAWTTFTIQTVALTTSNYIDPTTSMGYSASDFNYGSSEDNLLSRLFTQLAFNTITGKVTFTRPAFQIKVTDESVLNSGKQSLFQSQLELIINANSRTILKRLGFYRYPNDLVKNIDGEDCIIIPITYTYDSGTNILSYPALVYETDYILDLTTVKYIDILLDSVQPLAFRGNKAQALQHTQTIGRINVLNTFTESLVYEPETIFFYPYANRGLNLIHIRLESNEQELTFDGISWGIQLHVKQEKEDEIRQLTTATGPKLDPLIPAQQQLPYMNPLQQTLHNKRPRYGSPFF